VAGILIWKKQIAKPLIKKFIFSQIIILAVWSIWLILFFLRKLSTIFNQGWYFQADISRQVIIGIYDYFFLLLKNYWLRLITGTIIFSAPFIILLWADKKVNSLAEKINPNWFLFAWILPAILISIISQINFTRIFIIAYSGFYLIVSYLFYITFTNRKKLFWLITIFWFAISIINLKQNLTNNYSNWNAVNQWLNQNQSSSDKIIIPYFPQQLSFQYYYTGQQNYDYFYPLNDNQTLEQRIIEKNWQNIITPNNIDQLRQLIDGAGRILIVNEINIPDYYFTGLTHQWLIENNWQIIDWYQPNELFGPRIIVYTKKSDLAIKIKGCFFRPKTVR